MGKRGPKPIVIPGTNKPRILATTITVFRDEWPRFVALCESRGTTASARLRQFMAHDLKKAAERGE